MRLAASDINSHDILLAMLVNRCEIFLDGVKVEGALEADEEAGHIERYIPKDDPRRQGELAQALYWPSEWLYGKVEIKEGGHRAELVMKLRQRYDLIEVDAENVMLATDGLLGRALIELGLAWRDFWRGILK